MLKRHRRKFHLTTLIYLPILSFLAYVSFRAPETIMAYGYLGFIPALFLLYIAFSKWGNFRLGEATGSRLAWIIHIWGFQLVSLCLLLGASIAFFEGGPLFSHQGLNYDTLLKAEAQSHWLWWSLFPWSGLLIWSLCLSYYYVIQKKGAYPHQAMQDIAKGFFEPQTKALIETTVFSANLLCLSMILGSAILLFAYVFQVIFDLPPHSVLPPIFFLMMGLIMALLYWRLNPKRIRVLERRGLTLFHVAMILFVLYAIGLVYISYGSGWMMEQLKTKLDLKALQCDCLKYFDSTKTENRVSAFFWGWCLIGIPLAGAYLVKISRGRTFRELIATVLVLPVLFSVLMMLKPSMLINAIHAIGLWNSEISSGQLIGILVTLGLIALWVCYVFMAKQKSNRVFYIGPLEDLESHKPGRTKLKESSKVLGLSKASVSLFLSLNSILILQAIGGWYAIQIQLIIVAPWIMHYIYGATIILFAQLKVKKAPTP